MEVIDIVTTYSRENEKKIQAFREEHKDTPLTLRIVDPYTFHYMDVNFLKEMNITFNEYEGGYYLGDDDNPYFFLVTAKPGAEKIIIHKDTKRVKGQGLEHDNSVKEIIIMPDDIRLDFLCFHDMKELRKVTFLSKGKVSISNSFKDCLKLETVNFSKEGTYTFYKDAFVNTPSLKEFLLPRNIVSIEKGAFLNSNIDIAFIPKHINRVQETFSSKTVIYYEGESKEYATRTTSYISSDDYSFNFHRGPMSSSTYTEEVPLTNHIDNVTYEEFLEIYKKKYNK